MIVVILLGQRNRCANSENKALQAGGAERAAAETETILVQIGLQVVLLNLGAPTPAQRLV